MSIAVIIYYIFIASFSIQVFYWIGFLRLIFHKGSNKGKKNKPISIIVCAWNELENLKELVPQLLSQEHPSFEVIIVDDRSVDGSYEYLIDLRDKHENLKLVRVDQVPDHMNAKKYAVTLGVKAAANDLVLLTDADCRPQSNQWAMEISRSFDKESVFVLGYSPYTFNWSLLNIIIQFETLLTGIHYMSAALWGSPYMAVGRNLAYRKSFFLENKGFSGFQGVLGGDDDLFVNRHASGKNTRVCVLPEAIVETFPKKSWKSYLIQKKRHLSVGKHYKFGDKLRLGFFTTSQVSFWICLVILAFLTLNPYVIAGGFGCRLVLQSVVMGVGAKKLNTKCPIILLPFIDLLFAVYLPAVGIPALFAKKIKWS